MTDGLVFLIQTKYKSKDGKILEDMFQQLKKIAKNVILDVEEDKVDIMDAKQHDYILSITSHIPHLIAYNIVNTSLDAQEKNGSSIVKYSAGGLRDFTRIAASNPIMWRDIFIQNKKNSAKIIDKFIKKAISLI